MISSCSSTSTSCLIVIMLLRNLASSSNLSLFALRIAELMVVFSPTRLARLLSALACLFSFPRVYTILNLYCPNSLAY